jgi:RNA recognition motif-containing protein
MSKNLYVGNLSFEATEADLATAFGAHGTVTRSSIVMDRDTGRSRGFGFVEMSDGGDQAIQALNGTMMQGRTLTVNEAKPREERPRSGSGGGFGNRNGGSRRDRY